MKKDDVQAPARREFIQSAGGLGASLAIGAAGLAALSLPDAARAAAKNPLFDSKYGKGPALKGPYIDLTTGAGNQNAYARLQGDIDFGKQKYFWFSGYLMGVQPGKKIVDLMGTSGFGAIRLLPGPDGAIRRMCREVIIYTDLRSGEVLDEWKNPLTGEMVKAHHVSNDPFNYLIEDHFPAPPSFGGVNKEAPPPRIPFIVPWKQYGDMMAMEIHIHLAYPSALSPAEWPRESPGPISQVSELFSHFVKTEDLQNPKKTALEYHGDWYRITPWLPWMLMDQAPGMCQYSCTQGTTWDLEKYLTRPVLDYAEKNFKKFFEAPTEWSEDKSLSSLENYARDRKPAPPKAK